MIRNFINKNMNVSLENIVIKKTEKSHARAIHAIDKECFSDPWSMESIRYEITMPKSICFVAVNTEDIYKPENNWLVRMLLRFTGERIVGHITMRHVLDEGHINNIAVTKRARRHGIGQKLIESAISESKKLGITKITLEVRSKNHPAISLYEKLGFKTCGLRKEYYRNPPDDAIVMVNEVNANTFAQQKCETLLEVNANKK